MTTPRYNAGALPDEVISKMLPRDRKALGVLTPEQRSEKAEGMAEKELQRLCEQELHRRMIPYLHLSPMAREKIGWPDLTFPLPPDGRFVAVELKSATGKVKPEQADMLADMAHCGASVHVCRSFDEFLEVLSCPLMKKAD